MTLGKVSTAVCTSLTTTSINTVFLPVVNGYEYITPVPVQTGVSNFYNNINEVRTFYNSLLQAKGEKSLITFSRFLTNTILGIGGLFDPATYFDLKRQNEDFGQTLGVWGVGAGPYLVITGPGPRHRPQRQRLRRGQCRPRWD